MSKPFQIKDAYFYKAKEKGYRARSAFKLLEIQEKFRILKPAQRVLDLGAAPGSFLQVIAELMGTKGLVVGIDLQEIEPLNLDRMKEAPQIHLLEADIQLIEPLISFFKEKNWVPFDVVTSDLAPKTSGIRDVDQGLSLELTESAYELATQVLKPTGTFIAKIFQGPEVHFFLKKLKANFQSVHSFKPKACRDRSFETYLVCKGFKKAKPFVKPNFKQNEKS